MKDLGQRIQQLRKQQGLSQVEMAKQIGVSKSQVNRYENKSVQPPADILNKLADLFGTSVDFLINGDSQEKAQATLKNNVLLQKFREMENLPEREQSILLEVIAAFIRDWKTKQAYV